jgi:hypothetical protein
VRATISEKTSAKVTVSAWSRNSCPAIPDIKTIGKNTAIVVRVAAKTAPATSDVPFCADSRILSPCSFLRTMFSSTTIELSTSIPTASAMPPSDMMFNDTLLIYISRNVPITETGIAMPVIVVARESLRKPYSTMIAIMPPRIAAFLTSSTDDEMNFDWS